MPLQPITSCGNTGNHRHLYPFKAVASARPTLPSDDALGLADVAGHGDRGILVTQLLDVSRGSCDQGFGPRGHPLQAAVFDRGGERLEGRPDRLVLTIPLNRWAAVLPHQEVVELIRELVGSVMDLLFHLVQAVGFRADDLGRRCVQAAAEGGWNLHARLCSSSAAEAVGSRRLARVVEGRGSGRRPGRVFSVPRRQLAVAGGDACEECGQSCSPPRLIYLTNVEPLMGCWQGFPLLGEPYQLMALIVRI